MLRPNPRFLLLTSVFCLLSSAFGQTVGSSLQGTIQDPSGAVVPRARVEVHNAATGALWRINTDEGGRYRAPLLPPGEYELRISAEGFQTVVRKGIHLSVGQDAVVDVALELGRTVGEITVVADAARINLTSGAVSGLVDDQQIRDLPLNGRSFQQLALLQPGVTAALAAGNDVVGGRTPKISINGARPEHNNFLLDGSDINNVYNKTPGSVAGVLLGVDAILEFQVLTNAYSAEFGRSAGGVINAVTRSGSNQLHGSAFEFLRNSALDAKNFFDPAVKPIPPFKRNQFGATVGGPIRRDKTFFFAAYESLIERLGISGLTNVPDTEARRGVLRDCQGRVQREVPVNPAVPVYLETFFPLPNGACLGGGAAQYLFSRSQPTDELFLQGRIDHRFSQSDTLFGRYTISNGTVDRQYPVKPPVAYTQERSRNQYVTLEEQHAFSAAMLNTVRLSFSRSTQEADNRRTIAIPPAMSWIPGEAFGYFTIGGLVSEVAGDFRLPRFDRLNNYQWADTLFLTRGRHGLRLGALGQRLQFNQNTVSQRGGVMNFANLENFLAGRADTIDVALPGLVDPVRGYRQWLFGFFAQDDVRLKSNLTVNLGLRYEFITVPTEANGKISNLRNVLDTQLTVGDPWHGNPSLRNFAPRVGLAWDPFRDGKTSIRAGFGLFFDQILPKYYFFSGSLNPPFTTRTSIPTPPFPNAVANFDPRAPIRAQLQTVNFDLQTPYITQFNFNVQRSLPGHWDLTVGYTGSRGIHLIRLGDANLAPETVVNGAKVYRADLGRRNRNFTGVWQRMTDAQSFYNALQVSAIKRFSRGVRAQVSYTFARSVDESSGINSQDFDNSVQYGLDWYDRALDRGLSSFFAQHNLTFNWTWDLPMGRSLTGLGGAILKGWQLNNITTIQSGPPFTVRMSFNRSGNLNTTGFSLHERPNVKAGFTNNPVLGGPNRYWDVNAFELPPSYPCFAGDAVRPYRCGERGQLGRNTVIGPGLVGVDVSLVKSWRLAERKHLQFRAEAFNLPNRPNFAVPIGRDTPIVASNWGQIASTVTTSRQIQLGLKLTF